LEEYPLVEEKVVGGVPAPYEKPLAEEVLEVGTVMHADIAIATRLHIITAPVRTIRVITMIIFPHRDFANRRQIHRESAR